MASPSSSAMRAMTVSIAVFGDCLGKAAELAIWVAAREFAIRDHYEAEATKAYWKNADLQNKLANHLLLVESELIAEYGDWPSYMPPRLTSGIRHYSHG